MPEDQEKIQQNILQNVILAPYTTWDIGGVAEYFIEAINTKQIIDAVNWAKKKGLKYRILGNGSNVLIPDDGLTGLTIINKSKEVEIIENGELKIENIGNGGDLLDSLETAIVEHRHNETGDDKFLKFADLDYKEEGNLVKVKFSSGVDVSYAIAWCLKNNLSGLQWYAGIPSTMGGALFNNIHGGTHHFSERFHSAEIIEYYKETNVEISKGKDLETNLGLNLELNWRIKQVFADFFNFGYDQSILREKPEIVVLSVTLNLFEGNVEKSKLVAMDWLKRKKVQPRKSCGSVFKNLEKKEQERLNIPTPSAGYVIDKLLGLTGYQIGNMQIPQTHGNFIVNLGGGTAKETLQIIEKVKKEALEKLGLILVTEVDLMK